VGFEPTASEFDRRTVQAVLALVTQFGGRSLVRPYLTNRIRQQIIAVVPGYMGADHQAIIKAEKAK